MRKLKYLVAVSVDGFIAHEDGSYGGFLPTGEHVADYFASLKTFDAAIMGRKTYETGLKEGVTSPFPMLKQYVFSRTMKDSPDAAVEIVSASAPEFVRRLKIEPGGDVYLCGGAQLAFALFSENLIDEMILKINPFLMGSGIALFSRIVNQTVLELSESKIYGNGVVWLCYKVKTQI